ncbi:MAG: hypothetical protein IT440_09640 [Phycisphaeraceae bacterium]|nr:hypothetical protein [Phycisphaeraceae bacterium]
MRAQSHEPSGLRGLVHRYPLVVTGSAMAMLLVSMTVLAMQFKSPERRMRDAYYYDMERGELFTAPGGQITPIRMDDRQGVLAMVFACGSCENAGQRFVAWLEMHNPQTIERLRQHKLDDGKMMMSLEESNGGVLIKRERDATWTSRASLQGRQLMLDSQRCGDGTSPVRCVP